MYSDQRTGVIDAKPAVKIQSASASPGSAIAPRAVVEVPMPDDGSTGSGAAVDIADALMGSGDEEVNQAEENESSEDDDEEEVDESNHAKLPSAAIRAHSPGRRAHTSAAWTHLRRIHKHDVPGHEMNADCTHVCVFPLADGEGGVKRFCNQPLKLFRASKALGAGWSTSASVAHSKKKHAGSDVARKQKARAEKIQLRLGECMQASGTADIQSSSSRHITYGLSENEKVLSAVARWGLYASMKVSQQAFEDPLFVAMLQAARGPHETKGVVPKLTRKVFKGFMHAEYQVTVSSSIC